MVVEKNYCSKENNVSNNKVYFESDTPCLYCDELYMVSCPKEP